MSKVHIVWDNSNIYIAGKKHCKKNEWGKDRLFRINFSNLIDLAADGRPIDQVFCVGSIPPSTDQVWAHIEKKTGKKPELFERGASSGREQAVDQALQTRMLRLGYDVKPPQTIVLLSGDGAGDAKGEGFFADLKRLHETGWETEVIAFHECCSKRMAKWALDNGVFVNLEDFYSQISFLEDNSRRSSPLNLEGRPRK